MKVLFILLTTTLVSVASGSYSQTKIFTFQLKNATILEILEQIEEQSDMHIAYDVSAIDTDQKIDIKVTGESVEGVLKKAFQNTDLSYRIMNRYIIISKKGEEFSALSIQQQPMKISGKVTDSDGSPLPGVTVVVKGTTKGSITDTDGSYSLTNVFKDAILQFSFVGMKAQEVQADGKKVINVVMEEDAIGIEEVVAIGYGTVKRRDLTGSVSKVDAGSFQEQSVYSAENALAGRISGVKVTDAAQPGAGASIQIRGSNSMLGGTEPLYVVDGVPVEPNQDARGQAVGGSVESSINFIDPSSIEKMEILKDASATAIYGARGANGVVIITTKQGRSDKKDLTFKYSVSLSEVSKQREVLNGPEFADWMNMSTSNFAWLKKTWRDYQQVLFDNGEISQMPTVYPWGGDFAEADFNPRWTFDGVALPLPDSPDLANTNWQDEVFRLAVTHNYNINYSGGSKTGTFSFGLNYLDQGGIILGSDYQRINSNLSISHAINDRLKISSRINFTKGNANAVMTNNGHASQNIISKIVSFEPTNAPLKEGETFEEFDFNDPNYSDSPIDIVTKLIDDKEQVNVLGSFNIDYNIFRELTFTATGALTYNANNRDTYWPMSTARGKATNGDATSADNQFYKYLTQYQLTYNKQFNKKHRINAVLVHSFEETKFRQDYVRVQNFVTDDLDYKNLSSGIDFTVPVNNFYNTILKSYLGRVNYSLLDRYLFTVSARMDGSSKFAKNNKWGYFPSGAFAWRMIEERFIKDMDVFSNLKLRFSYGRTGGEAINPYQSLATLVSQNYSFDGQIAAGYIEDNLENPDLRWEKTDQYNAGIDLGFLNNRINLNLDVYYKQTNDLLMIIENPPSSGFATKIDNVGSVENKGLEAEFSAVILNKKLKWSVNGNLSFNKSKVLDMGRNGYQYSSYAINGYNPIIFKKGESLGAFTGFERVKIFETWQEIANSAQPAAYVGDVMYKDQNNDDILNNDDFIIIGDPNPDALWGITNEFRYKKFDLSFLVDGQIGGDIYSIEDMTLESNFRTQATRRAAKNSWIPAEETLRGSWALEDGTVFSSEGHQYGFGNPDPYTATPMFNRFSNDRKRVSDEYVKDASFIKLRNISLGCNLNSRWIKSIGVNNMRIYASATNLIVITKFDGFDPEVTAFNKNPSYRGLDFGTYPLARTYTFGINVVF